MKIMAPLESNFDVGSTSTIKKLHFNILSYYIDIENLGLCPTNDCTQATHELVSII